ncbi:MAG: hypothetical protein PUC66_06515 [Erysipelotrichaceae bacterium]|nr:hypothetical protein [Erysipelotrichaceae bacterium]
MKKQHFVHYCLCLFTPLMMASCQTGQNSSFSQSYGHEAGVFVENLPSIEVGAYLDLSPYITAYDNEGKAQQDWSLSSQDENVVIQGKKVMAKTVGSFALTASYGEMTASFTLVTNDKMKEELDAFLAPLEEDPLNYTLRLSAAMKYYYTYYHTDSYFALVDEEEPTNSTIFATLSNGKTYQGKLESDAEGNLLPSFKAGWYTRSNYVFFSAVALDASNFTYQDIDGKVTLWSDVTWERNILRYGALQSPESNGLALAGARFDGIYDEDGDGTKDTAYFNCYVTSGSSSGSYCTLAISNVGTTSVASLDAAIKDDAYVPAPITTDEISQTFAKLEETKNYTLTTKLYSANEMGSAITPINENDGMCKLFANVTSWEVTESFDEHGVIASASKKTASFGTETKVTDAVLADRYAIWDDGAKTYRTQYQKATGSMGEKNEILTGDNASIPSAYTTDTLQKITLSQGISASSLNENNWLSKTKNTDGSYAYSAMLGTCDNDEQSNALFAQLLDLAGFAINGNGTQSIYAGETLTIGRRNYGMYYAYTYGSEYSLFKVNPSTGDINIRGVISLPLSDVSNRYIGFEIATSAIGSTTNNYAAL